MKHYLVILTILISGFSANSQTYEIGGMIGGANYIGDVGRESYIYPTKMVFGGIIKYNRSPRHSYRASLLFGQIEAKDSQSSSSRRNQRDYSFVNSIKEFSLGMEYTFWEFNVHSGKKIATPYLFTGFAVFAYDDLYQEKEGDTKMKSYHSNSISYAIPMAIGYKAKISQNLMLGLELGVRYTLQTISTEAILGKTVRLEIGGVSGTPIVTIGMYLVGQPLPLPLDENLVTPFINYGNKRPNKSG